ADPVLEAQAPRRIPGAERLAVVAKQLDEHVLHEIVGAITRDRPRPATQRPPDAGADDRGEAGDEGVERRAPSIDGGGEGGGGERGRGEHAPRHSNRGAAPGAAAWPPRPSRTCPRPRSICPRPRAPRREGHEILRLHGPEVDAILTP